MTGLLNSFQVFNVYIDRAMELLSDSEFRVLMYTTRHITGWQDRIDERQGCISISMFEKGFTTSGGVVFAGCGLTRQTIINAIAALVEYGFLERTGKPTTKGQKYTLETKGIDWSALEKRHVAQVDANKQRTAKASKSRRSGTLDDTGTSHDTMLGTLDDTMLSTSDDTQTKTSSKPTTKTSAPRKRDEIFDAIVHVWGNTASGWVGSMKSMMVGTAKKGEWQRCAFDPPVTDAAEILAFEAYMLKRMRDKKLSDKPTACVTIQRWFYDFRAENAKKLIKLDAPPVDLSKWETPDPFAFLESEGA